MKRKVEIQNMAARDFPSQLPLFRNCAQFGPALQPVFDIQVYVLGAPRIPCSSSMSPRVGMEIQSASQVAGFVHPGWVL